MIKRISDHAYLRRNRRPLYPKFAKSIRVVDLYSGVGSLSLGVWEACRRKGIGFESVAAIDLDPEAIQVYHANFPNSATIAGDVWGFVDGELGSKPTVTEKRLIRHLNRVDVLLAGSPCQGFSPLNNHTRGKDRRNSLYLRATRLLELIQPRNSILENVPNVVNSKRDVVGLSKSRMEDLGYKIDDGVIDLSVVGVPQTRKRHVLVASKSRKISVKETVDKFRVPRIRSVKWAIGDLEGKGSDEHFFDTASRQTCANSKRIDYLYSTRSYDLPNSKRPKCQRKSHSYKSMYSRLRYDNPAQTITSGFGSPGQGRFVHPTQRRTLTPHEAARLQFFPDFFDFSKASKRTSLATMIGNAATMKLSYIFASGFLS